MMATNRDEKEKIIIKTAMKLFATKGFNATPIQEIANQSGISKGAVYLHFKSKEDLLLAVFQNHYYEISDKLNEIGKEQLDPRTMFIKQLHFQFQELHNSKDFIIMQAREQALPFNDTIKKFIITMKMEQNDLYNHAILSIYSSEIEKYVWDINLMIQGIFRSFMETIIKGKLNLDFYDLSVYVVKRMDDLVAGLMKANEPPILNTVKLKNMFKNDVFEKIQEKKLLLEKLQTLKKSHHENEDLMITLDVLEEEMNERFPRFPVIRGMSLILPREEVFLSLIKDLESFINGSIL
jgi:AcrR family transcriptional regulator